MKYLRATAPGQNTLQLQSIGHVIGTPAEQIQKGNFLMWNFGEKEEVLEIVKQTEKTLTIKIKCRSGYIGDRKLNKNRLVCILQP